MKCVQGNDKLFQTLEKKKTCNPMWAETFVTHVDNPFKPITFQVCCTLIFFIALVKLAHRYTYTYLYIHLYSKVFDKDVVGSDDFMGQAEVELQELSLTR